MSYLKQIVRIGLVACFWLGLSNATVAAPQVRPFERDTLRQIEAAHRGQAFWLVMWDLECTYCMESLKRLAQAQRSTSGLKVVTISTDGLEAAAQVQARLKALGVRGQAYTFGNASAEVLRYRVDPAWRGEKPRAYRYDAAGGRKAFTGVLTEDQLAKQP